MNQKCDFIRKKNLSPFFFNFFFFNLFYFDFLLTLFKKKINKFRSFYQRFRNFYLYTFRTLPVSQLHSWRKIYFGSFIDERNLHLNHRESPRRKFSPISHESHRDFEQNESKFLSSRFRSKFFDIFVFYYSFY